MEVQLHNLKWVQGCDRTVFHDHDRVGWKKWTTDGGHCDIYYFSSKYDGALKVLGETQLG